MRAQRIQLSPPHARAAPSFQRLLRLLPLLLMHKVLLRLGGLDEDREPRLHLRGARAELEALSVQLHRARNIFEGLELDVREALVAARVAVADELHINDLDAAHLAKELSNV